jgi:hypothetical protein
MPSACWLVGAFRWKCARRVTHLASAASIKEDEMDDPNFELAILVQRYRELFGSRSIPASMLQGETSTKRLIARLKRAIDTETQVPGWAMSLVPSKDGIQSGRRPE